MTANRNGKILVKADSTYPNTFGTALLGVYPNTLSTVTITLSLTIDVDEGILNFGFDPNVPLDRVSRDMDPESSTYKQLQKTNVLEKADVTLTGSFFTVTMDDFGNEIDPDRYFFTPRGLLSFSPLIRVPTVKDQTFTLTAAITLEQPLEKGDYQLELKLLSSNSPKAAIILSFTVQDAASLFSNPDSTVWYHLV